MPSSILRRGPAERVLWMVKKLDEYPHAGWSPAAHGDIVPASKTIASDTRLLSPSAWGNWRNVLAYLPLGAAAATEDRP